MAAYVWHVSVTHHYVVRGAQSESEAVALVGASSPAATASGTTTEVRALDHLEPVMVNEVMSSVARMSERLAKMADRVDALESTHRWLNRVLNPDPAAFPRLTLDDPPPS